MSSDPSIDLEDLFQLEEEPSHEPSKTDQKEPREEEKEVTPTSDTSEPQRKSSRSSKSVKSVRPSEPEVSTDVASQSWHPNIIGTPKGKPNVHFQGVVSHDGYYTTQVLVPYADIKYAQRQVYVDDINLENPTVLETIYRIRGTFPEVVVRVAEDVFLQLLQHPEVKLTKLDYSWVSDHHRPRRNYIVSHDSRPTTKELAAMDKHFDEVEWALTPSTECERLKSKDSKYQDMPTHEEVPLPNELEPSEELSEIQLEPNQE